MVCRGYATELNVEAVEPVELAGEENRRKRKRSSSMFLLEMTQMRQTAKRRRGYLLFDNNAGFSLGTGNTHCTILQNHCADQSLAFSIIGARIALSRVNIPAQHSPYRASPDCLRRREEKLPTSITTNHQSPITKKIRTGGTTTLAKGKRITFRDILNAKNVILTGGPYHTCSYHLPHL